MQLNSESFEETGCAVVPAVLPSRTCQAISRRVRTFSISGGSRNLLSRAWCVALVERLRRNEGIGALVPHSHVAVQCTYFEKSALRNWGVPAHQDLSIPVAARVEGAGFSGWSNKEGSLFVQPPTELLQKLVAVRLHLEECGATDGPLKVFLGSHRFGRFTDQEVPAARLAATEITCTAEAGEALVMRPLLLHSSPKAKGASRRRVLHFVFGPNDPGHGLRWQHAV